MRRWLIFLLVLVSLTTTAARPGQSAEVEFSGVSVSYQFGKRLSIQATIDTEEQVDQVYLFLQPENAVTQIQPVELAGQNRVRHEHDLAQNTLRPFARVDYWFRVVLKSGEEVTSPVFSFEYHDNRFEWTLLEDEQFIAHWQGADLAFGQAILNTASAGLERALEILPAGAAFPLQIYVYPDAAQIQSALQLSGVSWVAGHASPDLGIVLVSVPPGPDQNLELERQLPHELMHILEFQAAGQAYNRMPFWLAEGLASLAELYPNPDYQRVLDRAVESNSLLTIESLCSGRPNEASNAFLAYAQSASFVRYLHQSYGSVGMLALIEHYRNGLGCAEAARAAFNRPLADLEKGWQQEVLGVDVNDLALQRLTPYLLLALFVLLPPLVITVSARRRGGQKGS